MDLIGAAVATNNALSAQCAARVLQEGGSAADAAILALLMDGIESPQSTGIGGGCLITHYKRATGRVEVLNAREFSPASIKADLFKDYDNAPLGLDSGIPGEIKGYWELHQRYGKLPWSRLFEDAIKICREGITVSKYFGGILQYRKKTIYSHPSLFQIFENKATGDICKVGEVYRRPQLANTLELISQLGPNVLYNGQLTKKFVQDIQNAGGIITAEDLKNYSPVWMAPEKTRLQSGLTIYTSPLPSCGAVLHFILKVFFELADSTYDEHESVRWFRLVETWKHAFGLRVNLEGPTRDLIGVPSEDAARLKTLVDPIRDIVKKTQMTNQNLKFYCDNFARSFGGSGTCHISILAPDGDAVSATSSINAPFGAKYVSSSTGILMNNHMLDFNFEPRKYKSCNLIQPNKQPLSSMCPSILLKKNGDVRMVIGAAGSSKILSAISSVITQHFLYDVPLQEAVNYPRLHHGLMPMKLYYERGFPFVSDLAERGHQVQLMNPAVSEDHFVPSNSSVSVIGVRNRVVEAYGDPRRSGCGIVI